MTKQGKDYLKNHAEMPECFPDLHGTKELWK